MKILWITPNLEFEEKTKLVLENAKENNYSFHDLINAVSEPRQIVYNKIHSTFGIKYVNKFGIDFERLEKDINSNQALLLKLEKIKIWLIKKWTRKTKNDGLIFYLISPHYLNDSKKIELFINNIGKFFQSVIILINDKEKYEKIANNKTYNLFHVLYIDDKKDFQDQILSFINETVF